MDEGGGGVSAGGGGGGAVLREDGYLRSALAAAAVRFHAGLNVLLLRAVDGELHVMDVHSGLVLQSSRLSSQYGVMGVEYVPGADFVFFWDARGVCARTDYNGVLLLHTALQLPLAGTQPDKLIKMELVLSEAVLLYQCLQSIDVLSVEGLSDVIRGLKKAIDEDIPKKGVKAQKWSTVCLSLPHAALRLVARGVVNELKSQNRRIPALAIAAAVEQRAGELAPHARDKDGGAPMYAEAARRDTFKRWPHMDYKWALPAQMSQAGFYHQPSSTGDDRAVCFTCLVCLVCWEKLDEPWLEHERHSPNCPLVRGEYTNNVPISVANATSCALPEQGVLCVSQGNTGNLIAAATAPGVITIWKFDCGLKKSKSIIVSPYDSIFSGILSSDMNKVWTDSFEKDLYMYDLNITAISFIGLAPEETFPKTPVSGEDSDKENVSSKDRPKPALICAVFITRTENTQSNPSIHEDNTSEKNLFNAGSNSPSNEYVKAMNDQNEGKNKNKSLFLLTYDINGAAAASTMTVVQGSSMGTGSKPGGSKKVTSAVMRPDDSNIYDEIFFQYSDEDGDLPPCTGGLMYEQINMLNSASSSKDIASKIWEPKKIIVTKHIKTNSNKFLPILYTSIPNSSMEHPIALLPELPEGITESVQSFVGHFSNLKNWKGKDSGGSNTGTKVTDQTDSAVLHSADGIHYINGPLEISDLKWYESGSPEMKMKASYGKTGTQTSGFNNGNSEGFDSDTAEEPVQICYAIQCLSLPNKLTLRDESQVTHLIPTYDGNHLLVVVSNLDLEENRIKSYDSGDEENVIDMDEIYLFMNGKKNDPTVEPAAQAADANAYLLLYKINDQTSTLTLEETPVALKELLPGSAPVDLCMLPAGKNDQPSVAVVGSDGVLRLYSLPDLNQITEKSVPQSSFVSVTYCTSVERLSVCTKAGTLHFYALTDGDSDSGEDTDEDELSNLDLDMLQKAPPTDGTQADAAAATVLIANKPRLDQTDLDNLIALTGMYETNASVPYTADVPGFWCELSPAQRPRSDHQNNKTWRLQNTASTWDEHILELTLPHSVNLAHIELGFTLHPYQPPHTPPLIEVTLLKQNLNGIGYEKDASFHPQVDSPVFFELKDCNVNELDAFLERQDDNMDHLRAHDAEIIAGPLLLNSGLDLTLQSGTLTLTSPRLFRAKGKTFLIHIKTLFDLAKDMGKTHGEKYTDSGTKKADFIGCDWLHQISITVRSCPHTDIPQERQQRIAMLESNNFLSNLFILATDYSNVERMKQALDLLTWVISIRLRRFRVVFKKPDPAKTEAGKDAPNPVEVQQMECIKIVERNIELMLQNCILRMKRSVAKKCVKILLITSEEAKKIPKPWECTFEKSLAEAVTYCVGLMGACSSPGSMCWLARLAMHSAGGETGSAINLQCLKLLEMLAAEVERRGDRYHSLLQARFGLYGLPMERSIFDVEGPALGKSTSTTVTYSSVLVGETPAAVNPQPKPDHQLKDLYNLVGDPDGKKSANSGAWWNQQGINMLSAGKCESMALHVSCHAASDGTKLEQAPGRPAMSAVSAFPGDPAQLWSALKEEQLKQEQSQEWKSAEDGENPSPMDCDATDKNDASDDAMFKDGDVCAIPWAQLVVRPPQPTLVVERMHSGARRFIVLDFGHAVRLTDIIIPSCSDLVTLSVDVWLSSEERDGTKLVFATDISSRHLLLTDIQPPPLCRYMKITTIGRYGMSAMKCKIPLGWFYGEIAEIANPQASVGSLLSLQQDLTCRFRLATAKLKDILDPYLEQYNGNAAHMMAYLKSPNDTEPKVLHAYQECIELQQQLHTVGGVLEKLRGTASLAARTVTASLSVASTDKLRVVMENLLDILLYINCQPGDTNHTDMGMQRCARISRLLWWCAPRAAAALATLLARACGAHAQWGRHLADTLVATFAAVDSQPAPHDRCLVLLIYMARKSLLASPNVETGVVEALAERTLQAVESGGEPALAACLLVVLAACLDSAPAPSAGWYRWDFVTGGRPGAPGPSDAPPPPTAHQLQRRKIQKKLIHNMQEAAIRAVPVVQGEQKTEKQLYRERLLQSVLNCGRRQAARAPERDGSPDARPVRLITPALAARLTRALLARVLTVDNASNADMLILCAKVVGRLCAVSPGMVGVVRPPTLLALLSLAAALPPWPRHALTNLLQDLVEYESAEPGGGGGGGGAEGWSGGGGGSRPAPRVTQDDNAFASKRLALKNRLNSVASSSQMLDYHLPLVLESDDSLNEDWLDQYYLETIKKSGNTRATTSVTNSGVSVCMDARLESGMAACSEVAARRLLLTGAGVLAAAVRAPGAVAERAPPPTAPPAPAVPPAAHTLVDAFTQLAHEFPLQDDCRFMENVVSLWLTLNGSAWGSGGHIASASGLPMPIDKPRIRLSADTVHLLLASLVRLENVSLRCWVLSMQALAWVANMPLQNEGSAQTMSRVILDSEHFVPAIVKFANINVSSDGAIAGSDSYLGGASVGAGAAATGALQSVLARVVSGRGAAGARAALRCVCGVAWREAGAGRAHDLRAALLRAALALVPTLSAHHAHHAVSLMETVACLTCEWISVRRSGAEPAAAAAAAEAAAAVECRPDSLLTGLLADAFSSAESKTAGRRAPCPRSVLVQLLHLGRRLLTIPLQAVQGEAGPSSSTPTEESQTDESKATQQQGGSGSSSSSSGNVEDERKQPSSRVACIADVVLQHKPTMQRLFRALSLCQNSIVSRSSVEHLTTEAVSVSDELFKLVFVMSATASHPNLLLTSLLDFLRKKSNFLSDALVWFIRRTLEKPDALAAFIELDGIEVIAERLTSCHYAELNARPGLVSSLMNYLKLPPQLVNLSTPASGQKKGLVATVETPEGLVNFAPLCSVGCGNPTAQAADVLLGGGGGATGGSCAARRVRAATWSYHFFSAEDTSLALTLTLPHAVLLHEVDLQPHVTNLATCPGAVGVEAGCGGTLAPLGPPQNTAGMLYIRLALAQPVIATTVQIVLYKPRDSSNMGLLSLRLLGTPAFSSSPTAVTPTNTSGGWAGVLALCVSGVRLAPARWAPLVSEGALAACAALLAGGGPAARRAHAVLLATALACPDVQRPLLRRLLALDSLAHLRAYQSGDGDSNAPINAVCELLHQLCVRADERTRDRLDCCLAWLAEGAQRAAAAASSAVHAAPAAPAPSSAFVQCLAEILWAVKESNLLERVEELVPDELFLAINTWVGKLECDSLLKSSLDAVLCSICYIRPDLFRIMLQEIDATPTAMEQDDASEGMEGLTDDGKVEWSDWRCEHVKLEPSRLSTVAAGSMSPRATTLLLNSQLPTAIVRAVAHFSLCKLQTMNAAAKAYADCHMTDSDKVKDRAATPDYTGEPVPLALMPHLLLWLQRLCLERRVKDWLGGPVGCVFWRPLLLSLCLDRVDRTWQESELVAEVEERTIQLFSALTTCHPHNQRLFAATLHHILESHAQGGAGGISGFTRALILRLLLSSERATVGVRWAAGAAAAASGGAPGGSRAAPGRHPAARAQRQLALSLHTTVRALLRDHIAPALSSSKWSGGGGGAEVGGAEGGAGGGGGGVQRSASDGGLHAAADAFELSVAAARTAKDKRSKDASNSSLKQQLKKRNHCRLASASQDGGSDELASSLRVQLEGVEGFVPPNATLAQLSARSPHVFGPHITLTLHYANKTDTRTWEAEAGEERAEGGGALLREFGLVGGLALVAAQLPRPHAAPPPPHHPPPVHDLDWVKLDDSTEEVVDLGVSSTPPSEEVACAGVPPHALAALGLLLKLPGYAEALLDEGPRAIHLLRLLLGVTDTEDGRSIVVGGTGGASRSLGTLPFRVVSALLEAAPLRTDDGRLLRRSLLAAGAVRLVLGCLAVFTHHQPEAPAGESQTATGATRGRADDKHQLYWAKGTGYGTGSTQQSWNVEQALVRQRTEEEHVTVLLQMLASYMAPGEQWPPDEEVLEPAEREAHDLPPEFIEQLSRSALVPAICSYLRNDSVLDMSRHIPLYVCVLRCARALWSLRSRALAPSLRPVPRLLRQMSRTTNSYASKLKMNRKNSYGKMTYSQRFNSSLGTAIEMIEEDEGLAGLIMDIQATAEVMCRADSDEESGPGGVPRPISGATREARYIEVMRRLQFDSFEMMEECPDNDYRFTVSYHFESAVRLTGERSHPARMKRLAQEAATLSTSLPLSYSSSVFVRTDTDRLDVMKVLITGPSDTPYANGCFVLDVYFPADYPSVPMLINLETTGRHSVRFNPNLYNDGKVCLSVLNTWHGRPEEKWNAHTSSFLQVLVSIQSLILVPEPYFNEPGYERSRGTRVGSHASTEYNSNIYQACVRWAMLDHLRSPAPCFKQVIQTHFWIKRNEVMQTIAGWITELEGQGGDKRTQRNITLNLMALKRHYLKIQEELAKLPVPAGLEELDEPFVLPAPPAPAPPSTTAPAAPAPAASPPHDDMDHDMEKLVSQVLSEPTNAAEP